MSKKYVSLDRLADYDALIKQEIANSVSDKADSSHSHDGRYYTETEINAKIADINTTIENHNHDSSYDALGSAEDALSSAKTYADNAVKTVKNDLLNNAGEAYDTLKELGDLIDDNADAIDALEKVAAGKADKVHTHEIADVSGLQTALDGKAASSHGTHVSYSTTAPVMDGAASVGSASTVARSDHKHPTDTSRASKDDFDNHTSDTTAHMTSAQKTQLSTAYNHSQAAHAPSNAQANQNAFSNIAVSGQTTVAADTTTDTITFAGSNVSITTDATNDKVTFTVADGSTSTKGVLKLTNSTSSTSTTTAATPSSVKSAYDLANTAKTNAATAQTRADNAYTLAEGKVDSLSDLGITATATELNYVDGVTSNVQTQLNGKAASSHNHSASNITSGTLSSDRLPVVTIAKGGTNASTAAVARDNLGFTYGSAEPTGTPDTGEGSVYFRTGGDAIVEVGTSGIWTYRKWASGIAECWGSKTYTVAITSASGSNYYVKLDSAENYPFTFAAVPQQFATLQSGSYAAWLEINASSSSWPSTTNTGYQMLVSTVSRASGTYTVAYHVIGRWK